MPEAIKLEYDPLLLPTAQHRAGLAGLLVLADTLRKRGKRPLPYIEYAADGRVQIRVDEPSLNVLFEDLYAATEEEQPQRQKRKGRNKQEIPPLREEVVEEGGKRKTLYYYKQVVPRAPFLSALQTPSAWIKLWRDAVWSCVRGVPNTRIPYEERSAGESVSEAGKCWNSLQRHAKARAKNTFHTIDLSGALYLGSQAVNADRVPFRSRADEAMLLHFWPVVMTVSVPWAIDRDGKRSRQGYLLTLPDVCDIQSFQEDFRLMSGELSREMDGMYPKDAGIALPEEGALAYLANLAAIARTRARMQPWVFSVAGVEVFHMDKRGNSIPVLYSGRVAAETRLLEGYEAVRRQYRHILFRRQVLLNLLKDEPWYRGFGTMFATQPHTLFLGEKGKFFQLEVNRKMQSNGRLK